MFPSLFPSCSKPILWSVPRSTTTPLRVHASIHNYAYLEELEENGLNLIQFFSFLYCVTQQSKQRSLVVAWFLRCKVSHRLLWAAADGRLETGKMMFPMVSSLSNTFSTREAFEWPTLLEKYDERERLAWRKLAIFRLNSLLIISEQGFNSELNWI